MKLFLYLRIHILICQKLAELLEILYSSQAIISKFGIPEV